MTETQPLGVIAIMTSPDGHVVASVADFERQAPGGYQLWEAQRYRARQQVMWATVRAYCSDAIVGAITDYLSTQIAEALCRKGHRITCQAIGWGDEIAAEVARS